MSWRLIGVVLVLLIAVIIVDVAQLPTNPAVDLGALCVVFVAVCIAARCVAVFVAKKPLPRMFIWTTVVAVFVAQFVKTCVEVLRSSE
jgi:hypothetical protein